MDRLRNKFNKLSTKWPASRSTSPAPSQPPGNTPTSRESELQAAVSTGDETPRANANISERLWNQAYDNLKDSESSKIAESYERILSDQLRVGEGVNIIARDHAARWHQMEKLTADGIKNTAKDVERKESINQWLEMCKPLKEAVGTGLKAVPQAAIPWAGICCALEILSSPLTEPKKNREGMEYVLKRMDWYWRLSPWLLQDCNSSDSSQPLREQLEKQIVQLNQKLLLFQMKSVILYHRGRFAVFMRDLPKIDDWATHVKEIKDIETALGVDSNQYNTLEMRTNLQDISVTTREHARWQRQDRLDEKDNECLRELRVTNPSKDKKSILFSKGGLFYDSYRWIMESKEYQQWLKKDNNNLLWIKGDPGKGKTMLLAGIIEELERSAPKTVFYFFCQATEPRLRTATNVLRGLIWFLVRNRPCLMSHVREEYDREGKGVFNDGNAWQTLTGILTAILDDEESQDCVFAIDALDECTTDRDQLIRLISRLSTCYKPKWVVSSRNWPEIERRLDSVNEKVQVQLELNHAAISEAVKNFIVRKVDQLSEDNGYSKSTREEVQNHLMANADDTFLWVSLVCEELGQPDVMSHHTLDVLKSFPAGLGKLYERMIDKLNQSRDRDLCVAVLGVVGVAYRPLSLAELGASDSKLNQFTETTETLSNIVRSCGSFLAIRNGTVYTVHQSVKDFLRTSHEVMKSGVAQQHCDVFLSCMAMMQKGLHRDLFRLGDPGVLIDEIETPEPHALLPLEYACLHWADHFYDGNLHELQGERVPSFSVVVAFLKEIYLYWLEAMSLLRCASEAIIAVGKLKNLSKYAPKEVRELVIDAWRFVLTHRSILDTAPLQLYNYALIFSPNTSTTKRFFEKEIPNYIEADAPAFQNWDACLQTIPLADTFSLSTMEFSPDGNLMLVAVSYGKFSILNSSTGGIVASLDNYGPDIQNATWHPSGQQFAVLTPEQVHIGDLSERNPVITYKSQGRPPDNLSFSPDGQLLASRDYISIHIWDVWNPGVYRTLAFEGVSVYLGWVSCTSATPCLLLIREHEKNLWIDIWDINNECFGSRISSVSVPGGRSCAAAISHDRTRLALVVDDSVEIYCWDRGLFMKRASEEGGGRDYYVTNLTWTADDKYIIFSSRWAMTMHTNQGIGMGFFVWDEERAKEITYQRMSEQSHVYCGKGNRMATTSGKVLRIWDFDTVLGVSIDQAMSDVTTKKSVETIRPSPMEPIAVYYMNEKGVDIISRVSGKTLIQSKKHQVVFGYDGCLALIDDKEIVEIWQYDSDCDQYHSPSTLRAGTDLRMVFGPPGQVAIGDGRGLRIYDTSTSELLSTLSITCECAGAAPRLGKGHIAFSRNGQLAIVHGLGCKEFESLIIWDTGTMKEMQNLSLSEQLGLKDYRGIIFITAISISENGLVAIHSGEFVWIASVKKGTWVRKYSFPYISFINFINFNFDPCSGSQLETNFGVLDLNLQEGIVEPSSTTAPGMLELDSKEHWDPNKWSVCRIGAECEQMELLYTDRLKVRYGDSGTDPR
ncbi:hypothetical protein HG531_010688 [Fusarium graminearum]|nr:hypothetical protein HG531_010688 [Fusarium graminearum]